MLAPEPLQLGRGSERQVTVGAHRDLLRQRHRLHPAGRQSRLARAALADHPQQQPPAALVRERPERVQVAAVEQPLGRRPEPAAIERSGEPAVVVSADQPTVLLLVAVQQQDVPAVGREVVGERRMQTALVLEQHPHEPPVAQIGGAVEQQPVGRRDARGVVGVEQQVPPRSLPPDQRIVKERPGKAVLATPRRRVDRNRAAGILGPMDQVAAGGQVLGETRSLARMRPRHVLAQAGVDDVEQLAVPDDAAAPAPVPVGALTPRTVGRGNQRVRQPAPVHEVGTDRVAPVRGPGQPGVPVRAVVRVVLEEHVVLPVPDERQRVADVPGFRLVVEGGSVVGVGHARPSWRGCRRHARPLECAPEEPA